MVRAAPEKEVCFFIGKQREITKVKLWREAGLSSGADRDTRTARPVVQYLPNTHTSSGEEL